MSTSSSSPKMIELRSSDGESFHVEESIVLQSETIKHMIDDDCADAAIPLPNVTSKILAKVIEFINKHAEKPKDDNKKATEEDLKKFDDEFVKVDHDTLRHLVLAANYLSISSMLDVTCQAIADWMKYLSVEEVREKFGIPNDFTREEEDKVRKENAWAFE